jgi:hypothetical protein
MFPPAGRLQRQPVNRLRKGFRGSNAQRRKPGSTSAL